MVSISSVEVAPKRDRDVGVASVVGGIQHEFAQGLKVALGPANVARAPGAVGAFCCRSSCIMRASSAASPAFNLPNN